MMSRQFDVIIFGATGFTGKHCVYEAVKLLEHYKWAIAGRNKDKLQQVLQWAGKKAQKDLSAIPIVMADVSADDTLKRMASQCKVLVNCAGPYRFYGEPVVRACIAEGTDHVDVTGEPQFMEKMQLEYDEQAQKKGVYVVSACGYDSIPAEMGVAYVEQKFEGTVHSSEIYIKFPVKSLGATINYGTYESAIYIFTKQEELREIREKLFKGEPVYRAPAPKLENKLIHKAVCVHNQWCIPNHTIDQSVMDRTQRFFSETEKKRPIQTREYNVLGSSILPIFVLLPYLLILFVFTRFKAGIQLLLYFPRFFTAGFVSRNGPSEQSMKTSNACLTFHSKGWAPGSEEAEKPTHEIITQLKLQNIAYGATNVALLLSAITLLTERDKIPGR